MTNATNIKPATIQHFVLRWIQFNFTAGCTLGEIMKDIKRHKYFDEDSMMVVRHMQDLMDRCGLQEFHTVRDLHMTY